MKRRSVRMLLFTLVPLLLLVGVLSLLTFRQMRQDRLNHTLIAALKAEDYPAALRALQQGADARTRDYPPDPRSFWHRLLDQLHGKSFKVSANAPTALDLLIAEPVNKADEEMRSEIPQKVSAAGLPTLKDWEAVLQALLKGGANPNDRDPTQHRPLMEYTVAYYPVSEVKALFQYGVRLDVHSKEAQNCLQASLFNINPGVTAFLLDRGISPNISVHDDWVPLLTGAVRYDNKEAVQALLDRGASVNVKVTDGHNALEEAEEDRRSTHLIEASYMIFPILNGMPKPTRDFSDMDSIIALLKAHGATSRRDH